MEEDKLQITASYQQDASSLGIKHLDKVFPFQ